LCRPALGHSAVGVGIAFAVVAADKAGAVEAETTALRGNLGEYACWEGRSPIPPPCAELHDLAADEGLFRSLAFWTILTGTAVGTGTAIYALTTSSKGGAHTGVAVSPVMSLRGGGLVLRGAW
jgi:hypothetical protein